MRKNLILLPVITIIVLLSHSALGYDDNDFQYWNRQALSVLIRPGSKFVFHNELRIGDTSKDLYHNHTELGLVNTLGDFAALGVSFRYMYSRGSNASRDWRSEFWPIMALWLKYDFGPVAVNDRSRFEYRVAKNGRDKWWYRNRFEINLPVLSEAIKLRPYIANEIFMDISDERFSQNRIFAGLRMKIMKHLMLDTYYLRFYFKAPNWKAYNVFATTVKAVF